MRGLAINVDFISLDTKMKSPVFGSKLTLARAIWSALLTYVRCRCVAGNLRDPSSMFMLEVFTAICTGICALACLPGLFRECHGALRKAENARPQGASQKSQASVLALGKHCRATRSKLPKSSRRREGHLSQAILAIHFFRFSEIGPSFAERAACSRRWGGP
jgi:hypothetical protein